MARLIRTEKEVEGRREEIWLVVDEDALEQWPAGPLEVVGRPAPRNDGLARARGQARYTADVQFPGMLHAAVLRSPYAHARARRLDLASALAAPGVRGAIGPGDVGRLIGKRGRVIQAIRLTHRLIHIADIEAVTTGVRPEPKLQAEPRRTVA